MYTNVLRVGRGLDLAIQPHKQEEEMNQNPGVQRKLEQFMRTYGMWMILGLMVLEFMLEWRREQG